MKKYFSIAKINLLNNINYFGEIFFRAIFILLILFIFINLWQTVYGGKANIEGFTIAMMVWYLVMTEAIVTSASPVVREINKEIQTGDVAHQLNKPYNYVLYHYAKAMSYRVLGFLLTFCLGGILVYLMLGGFAFSWSSIPFLIVIVFLALTLDFFMIMCIALIGFWFEDTNSFRWIYDKIIFTLGGMLVPLEIFPTWLKNISQVLPFSYVAYHPAKLFVSFDFMSFLKIGGIELVYIAIFGVVAFLIYTLGTRRLNINGG